jgi:cystathionine gamma-lyase
VRPVFVVGFDLILGDFSHLLCVSLNRLFFHQNLLAAIVPESSSFYLSTGKGSLRLALRGLKTLALRMRAHCDNALQLARWLQQHPAVARVIYPAQPQHPGHALAMRQMSGLGGGIISIDVKGGLAESRRMLERCRLFALAESLGGVESLINHPAIMTHASVPPEIRARLGISDTLVRLSVGVEDVEDLQADLDQALAG